MNNCQDFLTNVSFVDMNNLIMLFENAACRMISEGSPLYNFTVTVYFSLIIVTVFFSIARYTLSDGNLQNGLGPVMKKTLFIAFVGVLITNGTEAANVFLNTAEQWVANFDGLDETTRWNADPQNLCGGTNPGIVNIISCELSDPANLGIRMRPMTIEMLTNGSGLFVFGWDLVLSLWATPDGNLFGGLSFNVNTWLPFLSILTGAGVSFFLLLFCFIFILLSFWMIAIQIVTLKIQFYIVTVIFFILLPFCLLQPLKFLMENIFTFVLSSAMRLFMIGLVFNISLYVIAETTPTNFVDSTVGQTGRVPTVDFFTGIFTLTFAVVMNTVLCTSVPGIANSVMTGQSSFSFMAIVAGFMTTVQMVSWLFPGGGILSNLTSSALKGLLTGGSQLLGGAGSLLANLR